MTEITVKSIGNYQFAGQDIPWLVNLWAKQRPDHPFIIWEPFHGVGRTWTYKQFADDVNKLAIGLLAAGVRKGEKVIIHLENSPEIILSWYACAKLGAVAVTTNTRSAGKEFAYYSEHSDSVGAITQPSLAKLVKENGAGIKWIYVTETNAGEPVENDLVPQGCRKFGELLEQDLTDILEDQLNRPADPMLPVGIQYTSGTTSRPKAVLWTHANALWGGQVCSRHEDLNQDDVHLVYLPFFHTNAQSYSVLASLWVGATAVILPKFSAGRFWDISLKHKCTWTSMVPFCMKALAVQEVPKHFYRCWGTAVSFPDIEELMGIKTMAWWGMTETITHGTVGTYHHREPLMTIGRPALEYELAIVDSNGIKADQGVAGHLLIKGVRGVSLFLEYYKNPEATAESFDENGWFRTGDMVCLMNDGYLYFADRDKDMLKVGGENVSAQEIETVILMSGMVDEVAVVAQRHYMLDEVPVAFIIPFPGAPDDLADKLIELCKESLADFKVPREVKIVDSLPRAVLEKIAKAELRKELPLIEK